ncbi:MAG: FAD-binding oxidoreductase [Pseudomonadota bacterium]
MKRSYESWGRYPRATQSVEHLYWRHENLPRPNPSNPKFLPFGNGRSYGDVCLNDGGRLLDCRNLDRFIHFDAQTGLLRCEAGVTFAEILALTVVHGWFLPVTPGTQYVTVGGAVANDVHGKNHVRAGTFGRHVQSFELLRSNGERLVCSPTANEGYFAATIGGLGLTGVITWVELQLRKISSPLIDQEVLRFANLNDFFLLAEESDQTHEYTVAWVDCLARGPALGRGLFMRGNHASAEPSKALSPSGLRLTFPIDPPVALVNSLSLRLFNSLYYRKQRAERTAGLIHFQPFFYPLDAIRSWNRMYGARGFLQYQCVVPIRDMRDSIRAILHEIGLAGTGSFLAVLKVFGELPSPGLLSFPMPGATLALDFPNKGEETLRLLSRLDRITSSAGGRIYPAKDACMPARDFQNGYPKWQNLLEFKDPEITSSFWRRVTASV